MGETEGKFGPLDVGIEHVVLPIRMDSSYDLYGG